MSVHRPAALALVFMAAWRPALAQPRPVLTSPASSFELRQPSAAIVTSDRVPLVVSDLAGADDWERVRFLRQVGATWVPIGDDADAARAIDASPRNHLHGATPRWSAEWDLGALSEGPHRLRVEAVGRDGTVGAFETDVSFDRTPPLPSFVNVVSGQRVSGVFTFQATTADEDVAFGQLDVYLASQASATQQGVGNVRQAEVGGTSNNGGRMFCAPTAAANALQRLNQANPMLFGTSTTQQVADMIASAMQTNPVTGTSGGTAPSLFDSTGGNLAAGLRAWLTSRGLGCDNAMGYTVTVVVRPTFAQYDAQIRAGQAVLVAISDVDGKGNPVGAHVLTGTGTSPGAHGTPNRAAFVDPRTGTSTGATGWSDPSGAGNVSRLDLNGGRAVLGMVYVCPKEDADAAPAGSPGSDGEIVRIEEGLVTPGVSDYGTWDTAMVHDGFYLVRATARDAAGNQGSALALVHVDNLDPEPALTGVGASGVLAGRLALGVEDLAASEDASILEITLEPEGGDFGVLVGRDDDSSDGLSVDVVTARLPQGPGTLRATVTDAGGRVGTGALAVTVASHGRP
jgi:hypothetical protein